MAQSEKLAKYFLSHRSVTVELAKKIEEENYEYQPTPTSMSASKLVTHILFSFYQFAMIAKSKNPSLLREKIEETETNLSELAEKYTALTKEAIESLTDEDLDYELDMTPFFGVSLTARDLLHTGIDHEIHHKGNLFVYVREMGHTDLPFFVNRG